MCKYKNRYVRKSTLSMGSPPNSTAWLPWREPSFPMYISCTHKIQYVRKSTPNGEPPNFNGLIVLSRRVYFSNIYICINTEINASENQRGAPQFQGPGCLVASLLFQCVYLYKHKIQYVRKSTRSMGSPPISTAWSSYREPTFLRAASK